MYETHSPATGRSVHDRVLRQETFWKPTMKVHLFLDCRTF